MYRGLGSAPTQRISGLSRARESARPPAHLRVYYGGGGVAGIIGYVAAGLSSRAPTRDLLYYAKFGKFSEKVAVRQNRTTGLVAFWGEGGLFYGEEIFPTQPTLLRAVVLLR